MGFRIWVEEAFGCSWMALRPDSIRVDSWGLEESRGSEHKRRRKKGRDGSGEELNRFWMRFRFLGSCACLPSRSKNNSSVSGTSTYNGNLTSSSFLF